MRLPHLQPFSDSPLYFFTACTEGRRALLACKVALGVLIDIWSRSAEQDGWYVGRFVLMPDHVHLFAMPALAAKPRSVWNKMWKSISARRLAKELGVTPPIWQQDTFDHILRSGESYSEKWNYVLSNPVRKNLCTKAEQWPWQGEIHPLCF